jgi:hypothetical protein
MKIESISRIGLISLIGAAPALAQFVDTRTVEYGLRDNPEVLVNSQGLAQHDLSVRGSSYAASGISLNGITLKAPVSAHFNSELPIPAYLLSSPKVQTGLDNISGHLVGTAAYRLAPLSKHGQASAKIGTKEHYGATLMGSEQYFGAFFDWEKALEIDYDANSMDRMSGGVHAQKNYYDWMVDFIVTHQQKEYGSEGYFGGAALDPVELDDTLLYLGIAKGDLDDHFIRTGIAYRDMDLNHTDSRFGSVMLEGRTMEIQNIAVYLRGDVENEYADGSDRTRGSVQLLPELRLSLFTLKAGLNSVFQTSESAEFLPIAGVDWLATDNSKIYLSYMETVQQPDYLNLAANPQLQMQKSQNTELGLKQYLSESMDWRLAGFYRRLEHASDWIGGTPTDLGTLNISGIDCAFDYYPSRRLLLQAYYQWVYKDNEIENGLYETDYPEHLLTFSGNWRFLPEFLLFAQQNLRYQTANSVRTSDDFGAEASLGLHYDPRFAKNMRLSFLVENLWGTDFQAVPGVKPRPTTASAGITVAW